MSLFGIGDLELLALVVIGVLIFGRKEIPKIMKDVKLWKREWEKPLTDEDVKEFDNKPKEQLAKT